MKLPIANCQLPIFPGDAGGTNWKFEIGNSKCRRAFTLIEIMIVVGIIGLVAAMGIPSIVKALEKDGMRKAVSDVQDVFFSAREKAIVTNQKVAVVIYPRDRRFGVEGASTAVNTHSGKTVVATLPAGIEFGMLDIFRQDYVQSDWAKIFFNADGTCDEAVLVLIGKGGAQKITLEYATGMPVVSAVDQ
jgi:prepilin-type N-terminal cleavage/methylation domain-containing protein